MSVGFTTGCELLTAVAASVTHGSGGADEAAALAARVLERNAMLLGADVKLGAGLLDGRAAARTAARAELHSILKSGLIVPLQGVDGLEGLEAMKGVNGAPQLVGLRADATSPVSEIALLKPFEAQGLQEMLGIESAGILNGGHMVAPAELRADGTAAIGFLPSLNADDHSRIFQADRLVPAIARHYMSVGLDEVAAATQAKVDVQLAAVIDFILTNGDRHSGNILVNDTETFGHFIDFGHLGTGELFANGTPDLPALIQNYQGGDALAGANGVRRVTIMPEVLEILRTVSPDELLTAHRRFMRRAAAFEGRPVIEELREVYPHTLTAGFGDRMAQRLWDIRARGHYDYIPSHLADTGYDIA